MLPIETVEGYESYDYIKRMSEPSEDIFPPIERFGVIEWDKSKSSRWAPPIIFNDKHYVYCRIREEILQFKLPTIEQLKLSEYTYGQYSLYSIPYSYRQRCFPENYFIVTARDGSESLRSTLTHKELQAFLKSGTKEEVEEYNDKLKNIRYTYHLEQPTKENPVKIYLAGMDDVSFSAVYPSMEDAEKALEFIEATSGLPKGFVFTN